MIQLSDFACIRQGKVIKPLSDKEAQWMRPWDMMPSSRTHHALLLLHGFSSSPAVFRLLYPKLQGYDRIVCPILPGHADSLNAFSAATAQQWLDCAHEYMSLLSSQYTHVSVLGFSLGGLLALELTKTFPIHHLYLLAPSFKLNLHEKITLGLIYVLQRLGLKNIRNSNGGFFYQSDEQEFGFRYLPLAAIAQLIRLALAFDYPKLSVPTEILLGRHDRVIDNQIIVRHYQHQPKVHIHWLENSAHILPLDGDVHRVAHILKGE